MARRKHWAVAVRSDDGLPFVVRAVQQYVDDPGYGLVVGVYQRTTGSGYSLLLPPALVAELRDDLAGWLDEDTETPGSWSITEPDRPYPDTLHLTADAAGLSLQVEHLVYGGSYIKRTNTALLKHDAVTELADALTDWLRLNELEVPR